MGAGGPLRVVAGGGVVQVVDSVASEVPARAPEIPAGVRADPELLAAWEETVPGLDATGLVTDADGPAIEQMLRHLVASRRAWRTFMDEGIQIMGENGTMKKNPCEAIFRAESAAFLEYAKQLGATWMARARTTASGRGEGKSANPFEAATG